MNEIASVAARYFDRFESRSLYPGPRTRDFWLSLLGALAFFAVLVWYLQRGPGAQFDIGAMTLLLLADGALLWSANLVRAFHERAVLALANQGCGSNVQSVATAKAATLCRFFDCRVSEFLRVATEVQQLRSLSAYGEGGRVSWRHRIGIDEQARSRLMSILLCVLAVLATLLATNPAIQDIFFATIEDAGLWKLIGVMQFLALCVLSLSWGAIWVWKACGNIATRWGVRLSGSAWATERKIDYLMRDLARLHRMPARHLRTNAYAK